MTAIDPASSLASGARTPGRLAAIGTTIAFVGYFVVLHALIVGGTWPLPTLALILSPWVVALASALRSSQMGPTSKALAVGLAVATAASIVVATLQVPASASTSATSSQSRELVARRLEFALYAENIVFLLALSALFAGTLGRGRKALVTRLARSLRDFDLTAREVRYTRLVTIAWAAFFAAAAALSTVLFFTQSRTAWSTFVNLLIWPAIAAMFALEYAIRVRVIRGIRHASPIDAIRAFRQRDRLDHGDAEVGPR